MVLLSYTTSWSMSSRKCFVAKEKWLLGGCFHRFCTHCAVWQKIVPVLNIILRVKMIVHFLPCILHFDKGRRSCPGASCMYIKQLSCHFLSNFTILIVVGSFFSNWPKKACPYTVYIYLMGTLYRQEMDNEKPKVSYQIIFLWYCGDHEVCEGENIPI